MTRERSAGVPYSRSLDQLRCQPNYYELLGLEISASDEEIRHAYRQKSKLYHPDTTQLPSETATEQFRALNEAYATLSNTTKRLLYNRQLKLGQVDASQVSSKSNLEENAVSRSSPVTLHLKERPLSAGELFALFILGLTFTACLILAIVVGLTQGETWLQEIKVPPDWEHRLTVLSNVKNTAQRNLSVDDSIRKFEISIARPSDSAPSLPDSKLIVERHPSTTLPQGFTVTSGYQL